MVIVTHKASGRRFTCKAENRHVDEGQFLPCQNCKPIKRWMGSVPEKCDICGNRLKGKTFIDGATRGGPWALMCPSCHRTVGVGIGDGLGQEYDCVTMEKIR